MRCRGAPDGNPVRCSVNPSRITVPPGGEATSEVAFTVGEMRTSDGRWPDEVFTYQSRNADQRASVTLIVPDSDVYCDGTPQDPSTYPPPESYGGRCSVKSLGGFTSPVALSCLGAPPDSDCWIEPSSVTPPGDGTVTFDWEVEPGPETPPGDYTVTLTGTSDGHSHSVKRSITVE